jgi:hypothetical protein
MAISKIVQNSLSDEISLGAKIQSVQVANSTYVIKDDTAVNVGGGFIVVTGQGFQSNCQVLISDGTTSNLACSVSFVSSTTVRAQVPARSAGTYSVYIINGDGDTAIRVNALQYSAEPTWVTASPLTSQLEDSNVSIQLSATNATSYVLQTGSALPTGLTLSSNGLISGTVNTDVSVETTFNFTVEAIDAENQETPKAFSVNITVAEPDFYRTVLLLDGDGTNGANNNVFRDSSNNNFAITRNGNTTQGSFSPFSPAGFSNLFAANNAVVYTSSGVIPQPLVGWSTGTGTATIEAWIYPTAVDTSGITSHNMSTIVGIGDTYFAFGVRGDSKLRLYWWTGSQNNIDSTGTIPGLNQWIHVAVTRNNSNIEFFINGVSAGTSASFTGLSSWGTASGGEKLQIGQNNGSGETAQFFGNISNLRFSDNVRTVTLPTSNYTSDANTLMLTCLSNRFRDIGPSNYTLTVSGTPSVINFTPFAPSATYSPTTYGGSAYFDGSGDYLTVPDNAAFDYGSGDFTLECWIYLTSTLNEKILTAHTSGGDLGPVNLWFSSGTLQLYSSSNGSTFDVADGATVGTPIVDSWNHVAVSRQGTSIRCFLNGVLGSTTTSSATLMNSTGTFQIGARNGSNIYTGFISNFRVVKGTAVYTSAFTPPTSPVTAIANTSLLTDFTNAGIYDWTTRNVIETVGNAQVNTSIIKYGTGSLAFANNNYLLLPQSSVYDLPADFTIEMWLYININTAQNIIAKWWTGGQQWVIQFRQAGQDSITNQQWRFAAGGGSTALIDFTEPGTTSVTTGTWNHIALTRSGSSYRFFRNGTQVGSTVTNSSVIAATTEQLSVGQFANSGTEFLNGNIDDLRITKGFARYTGNFTPPTSTFSKS